jgi:hypothetical protein
MDSFAPTPSIITAKSGTSKSKDLVVSAPENHSAVGVTITGCGGAGINLSRPHATYGNGTKVLFFDTSKTNLRSGETLSMITNGSGSGSHRAENARDIERELPQLDADAIGANDVAIVIFSTGGGSGSVLGPLIIREYHKRGMRVIGVTVVDTSSSVAARNTINTLKTLSSICANNDLYLPMIILSNDESTTRSKVDETSALMITDLLDILTKNVFEVDRNDRLNWINPTKVIGAKPGLKLISFESSRKLPNPNIVMGLDSVDMVDSLLILQTHEDEGEHAEKLPPSRLKKMGFYAQEHQRLVGKITGDISSIDKVIDEVQHVAHQDQAQKHQSVDRLGVSSGSDDLIL